MSDQRWLNALFNIGWLALRWHLQDLLAKDVWPTSKQLGWWALWRWADVICQCWANNSANKISTLVQWMTLHAIRETGLRFSFKQLGNQRWNMLALPPKNKVEMSTSILISNPNQYSVISSVRYYDVQYWDIQRLESCTKRICCLEFPSGPG